MVEARPVMYKALAARTKNIREKIYYTEVEVADNVFWQIVRKKFLQDLNTTGVKLSDVIKVKVKFSNARKHNYNYIDGKLYTENRISKRIYSKRRLDTKNSRTCVTAAAAVSIVEMAYR